jgi:hypothetical protein
MSTANAGIILLLRYYTTGTKDKKKVMHMITPLQTSEVTSIYHCSLSTGDHDQGSVQFKHHFTFCRFAMILHLMLMLIQTPNLKLTDFPKAKGEEKKCLFINIPKKREPNGGQGFFLSCVVNDVQMRADPCFNMAAHRQMVSCKIAQLSCKNRSTSREHSIRILDY